MLQEASYLRYLITTYENYLLLSTKDPDVFYLCKNEDDKINKAFIGSLELLIGGGGGAQPTNYITITVNPNDISEIQDITASGSVLNKEVSLDKDVYRFTVLQGGNATVTIIPKTGYKVAALNIDQVPQGDINTYVFQNITQDHTGYVWVEEVPVVITNPIYVRSDLPTQEYESLQLVLDAVKADYPFGLEADMSIS